MRDVVRLSRWETIPFFPNRRTTTILYLGIDQHARQLSISLRDEQGDFLQAVQDSTQPEKIQEFLTKLIQDCVRMGESFIAVLEVCGLNDWLIRLLHDYRCHKVILIQPEEWMQRKVDRRSAPRVDRASVRRMLTVSGGQDHA